MFFAAQEVHTRGSLDTVPFKVGTRGKFQEISCGLQGIHCVSGRPPGWTGPADQRGYSFLHIGMGIPAFAPPPFRNG